MKKFLLSLLMWFSIPTVIVILLVIGQKIPSINIVAISLLLTIVVAIIVMFFGSIIRMIKNFIKKK